MAITKTLIGRFEDGRPHYLYASDTDAPLVLTGPIEGEVTLPDGSVYDVTDPVIEVWPGHELAVSDAIGARYQEEGHPDHTDGEPFVHTPSEVSHTEGFGDAVNDERSSSPQDILDRLTGA